MGGGGGAGGGGVDTASRRIIKGDKKNIEVLHGAAIETCKTYALLRGGVLQQGLCFRPCRCRESVSFVS